MLITYTHFTSNTPVLALHTITNVLCKTAVPKQRLENSHSAIGKCRNNQVYMHVWHYCIILNPTSSASFWSFIMSTFKLRIPNSYEMLMMINSDVSPLAQCLIWLRSMPVSWRSPCLIGSQWALAWRAAPSVWCVAWWSSPTSPTYRPSPSGTGMVRLFFIHRVDIKDTTNFLHSIFFFYYFYFICISILFYFKYLFIYPFLSVASPESSSWLFLYFGPSSLCLPSCLLTDKLLKPSKLVEMAVGGGAARLTLPQLAKDDEGLYTLRIFTKDGTAEHSAYLFVSGRIDLSL